MFCFLIFFIQNGFYFVSFIFVPMDFFSGLTDYNNTTQPLFGLAQFMLLFSLVCQLFIGVLSITLSRRNQPDATVLPEGEIESLKRNTG